MSILEMAPADARTCEMAQLAKPLDALQSPMIELLKIFAAPSPAQYVIVRKAMLHIAGNMFKIDHKTERVEQIIASLHHKVINLSPSCWTAISSFARCQRAAGTRPGSTSCFTSLCAAGRHFT